MDAAQGYSTNQAFQAPGSPADLETGYPNKNYSTTRRYTRDDEFRHYSYTEPLNAPDVRCVRTYRFGTIGDLRVALVNGEAWCSLNDAGRIAGVPIHYITGPLREGECHIRGAPGYLDPDGVRYLAGQGIPDDGIRLEALVPVFMKARRTHLRSCRQSPYVYRTDQCVHAASSSRQQVNRTPRGPPRTAIQVALHVYSPADGSSVRSAGPPCCTALPRIRLVAVLAFGLLDLGRRFFHHRLLACRHRDVADGDHAGDCGVGEAQPLDLVLETWAVTFDPISS